MTTTVLQTSGIAPPPAAAELTVPLSVFDLAWIHFRSIRPLLFYDYPCSEADFSNIIVPNLKHSLSLALKHYLIVAAKLLYPLDTDRSKPIIRYVSGDSVPLTVAVSGRDFDELAGSHARESDQFYDFTPAMPPLREDENYKIAPLLALQVTLFPGRGICIGLSCHHSLGDLRSVAGFMSAWAEIARCGGDHAQFLLRDRGASSLPLLDRLVLGDMSAAIENIWNGVRSTPLTPSSFTLPTNRVRASFTLRESHMKKLKDKAVSSNPELVHVESAFVFTAAYTWSCLVKSAAAAGEEVDENQPEAFFYLADARERPNALIDPPVPANYFGNCLGGGEVTLEHRKLAAEDGFVAAVEAIADSIENVVNNEENFLKDLENWLSNVSKWKRMTSVLVVVGSPKFDFLDSDFGWGRGRRMEVLSMDAGKYTMSLCKSSEYSDDVVVGVSLPRKRMEAFAARFLDGPKL